MPHLAAARRYAEALFELATRDDRVDAWRADLATACELAANPDVVRVVDNPAVPLAERREALHRLLGRVSPQVLNLSLLLAYRGRFSIMPAVGDEYDDLVRRSRGIVSATITSAAPLTREELDAVTARVAEIAGAQVEARSVVDPGLIGGVSVMIGDLQIDSSVAGRLRRLRHELVQRAS